MSNIISSEKIKKHNINKYKFKPLGLDLESEEEFEESLAHQKKSIVEDENRTRERETDIIASEFIKLQMKLKNIKNKHKKELKKVKEKSYAKGFKEGKTEAIKESQSASKIVLKVNPADYKKIFNALRSLPYVEVMSESAVSVGKIVAISDIGNGDIDISKRFKHIKKAVLSE